MAERIWTGDPAFRVDKAVMTQRWLYLSAIHWRVDPQRVQAMLPSGLEVDVIDGSAWVGLIPFQMSDIRAAIGPPIPYLGTFPETNIRTYVTGSKGPGVWFNSLDISRLVPVVTARLTYRLPYIWSKMSIRRSEGRLEYECRRRWPGPRGTRSLVSIEPGERIEEPTRLDHFLSARWGLYTMLGNRLAFAEVEHEPWPLHRANLLTLEDELLTAAGYPGGGMPDHVMFSPGVTVRIERPHLA